MDTTVHPTQWEAVQNRQPPTPFVLRVEGKPLMPTPLHTPTLTRADPQGINPRDLILELTAAAPAHPAPQVVSPVPVHYEEQSNQEYDQVVIRSLVAPEPSTTVKVKVLQVHSHAQA